MKDKIMPMKRRRFGVSKTAKREHDWKFVLKFIPEKRLRQKYLRSIGRRNDTV